MKDFLFCLVGPSGSGKTTIAYELQMKHGYNVIESYTTRPPRYDGEKGHIFVDELEGTWNPFPWIDGKALPENIIAYNEYNGYEYWASKDQYQGKGISLYVVDVPGVEMLRKTVKDAEIVVIALWADFINIRDRLHKRGTDFEDIVNKAIYDKKAFAVIPCDYAVNANDDIKTVTERVNSIIQECLRGDNNLKCYKCGKSLDQSNNDIDNITVRNQSHYINLGRMGYGSKLDGCEVEFQLCDNCMVEFINTFKLKDRIYNSGSNYSDNDALFLQENKNSNIKKKCIGNKCKYYFSSDLYRNCILNPDIYLEENCIGIEKVEEITEGIAGTISKLVVDMHELSELEKLVEENQAKK